MQKKIAGIKPPLSDGLYDDERVFQALSKLCCDFQVPRACRTIRFLIVNFHGILQKVAAASGDMRKALHVCRGAVEMLEAELRECENALNTDANKKTVLAQLGSSVEGSIIQQVRLDHMASALAKTFRSAVVDTIQSLPQHQQDIVKRSIN
eukprot:Gb_30217 [translate_table: standard]